MKHSGKTDWGIISSVISLVAALIICIPSKTMAQESVHISKWYRGKNSAVSFRFDDNLPSHLEIVLPYLERYGMKGTFMVSPGRKSYLSNESEWKSLPDRGHELGNHTMTHKGAKNIEDAEYQIGEAARYIRMAQPARTGAQVFASGGGEYWGGKRWSEAGSEYHELVRRLGLIDLYDGKHPMVGVYEPSSASDLMVLVEQAAVDGRHLHFVFHQVGRPRLKDRIKKVINKRSFVTTPETFEGLLKSLKTRERDIWIAPLGDVLKYEEEYRRSRIEKMSEEMGTRTYRLTVDLDPDLYDHDLTLLVPWESGTPALVKQDGRIVGTGEPVQGRFFVDVRPVTSLITVTRGVAP